MKCFDICSQTDRSCSDKECRLWIDYEEDLNCTIIAANKNKDGMNLREIGERLKISFVRVKQIQDGAFKKLRKRIRNLN